MNAAATEFDVIIAGAGLAGATLALAAAQQGLRVALIEALPRPTTQQTGYDERSITLAYGSSRIFAGLGVWPALAKIASPIHRIHISERGRFGATRLDRAEEGVDALGYVVNARVLGGALFAALDALPTMTWLCPAKLTAIETFDDHVVARIAQDNGARAIRAQLLIGADGTDSTVRGLLGIGTTEHDYQQTAIVTTLTNERDHAHCAYERFTESGAIALLPSSKRRMGLVWMQKTHDAQQAIALPDAEFLARLQQQFGSRLGTFRALGARRNYPLKLVQAQAQGRARSVLIGNAAHALHPIGGQGFNLGLRDIATLAQLLADARRSNQDLGAESLLENYRAWRAQDQQRVVRFTDGLARVFESDLPPLAAVRPLGFLAATLCPPLKHRIARSAMGLAGRLPRVARGLPL